MQLLTSILFVFPSILVQPMQRQNKLQVEGWLPNRKFPWWLHLSPHMQHLIRTSHPTLCVPLQSACSNWTCQRISCCSSGTSHQIWSWTLSFDCVWIQWVQSLTSWHMNDIRQPSQSDIGRDIRRCRRHLYIRWHRTFTNLHSHALFPAASARDRHCRSSPALCNLALTLCFCCVPPTLLGYLAACLKPGTSFECVHPKFLTCICWSNCTKYPWSINVPLMPPTLLAYLAACLKPGTIHECVHPKFLTCICWSNTPYEYNILCFYCHVFTAKNFPFQAFLKK